MLNLARRPFVNRRPLHRLVTVLWVAALVLLSLNVWFFWSSRSTSTESSRALEEIRAARDTSLAELEDLQGRFRAIRLPLQNSQVEFLNSKLRERKFPWTRLFQELEEVLPYSVRIQRLAPRKEDEGAGRRRSSVDPAAGEWVALDINGWGRDNDSIYELVDALFDHSSFADPLLENESRERSGEIRFRLRVRYLARHEPMAGDDSDVPGALPVGEEGDGSDPSRGEDQPQQLTEAGGTMEMGSEASGVSDPSGLSGDSGSTQALGAEGESSSVATGVGVGVGVGAGEVRTPAGGATPAPAEPGSSSLAERARQLQEAQRQRQEVAPNLTERLAGANDGRGAAADGRTGRVGTPGQVPVAPSTSGGGSVDGRAPSTRPTRGGRGPTSPERNNPPGRRSIGADDLPERPRDNRGPRDDFPTPNASSGGRR